MTFYSLERNCVDFDALQTRRYYVRRVELVTKENKAPDKQIKWCTNKIGEHTNSLTVSSRCIVHEQQKGLSGQKHGATRMTII